MDTPVTVFYSYAENTQDQVLFAQLEKHLKILEHTGLIAGWHKQEIRAGQRSQQESDTHFEQASIILLLISPEFIASAAHYHGEMMRALEKQASGKAYVIPILLRPVYYENAPFAHLAMLPRDGRAITSWSEKSDEAFADIARALAEIVRELQRQSSQASLPASAAAHHDSSALLSESTRVVPFDISQQGSFPMNEETITVVIDALAYGATIQNGPAAPAARAAYERFYQLLLSYTAQYSGFVGILHDFLQGPDDWRGPLKKALGNLRIDNDRALMSAAGQLLATRERPQSGNIKFQINNLGHINQQNIGDIIKISGLPEE